MMYKENKQLQLAIHNLYTKLMNTKYGERYSWKQLQELAVGKDEKLTQDDLYHVVSKVGAMLMTNNMRVLITEHGFGKRLINPNEHDTLAKVQIKKSAKMYKKAGYILNATDLDQLNEDQKAEVISSANKYKTLEMFANEIIKKKRITKEDKSQDAALMLDVVKMFARK